MVSERILRELIEVEATDVIGAGPREQSETRTTWRNGHRERALTTQAGDLHLKIPKVPSGSFFPSLLERRRRIDQALFAVVMEAYVQGVSTRSVGLHDRPGRRPDLAGNGEDPLAAAVAGLGRRRLHRPPQGLDRRASQPRPRRRPPQ
ncbi:transposase [Streptomyces sp. NBC_00519]|uniref:transposase n=1 Tax=Streptomyces sp. NBC_00519 TaxID=2975764 RepID=UPI00386D8E14